MTELVKIMFEVLQQICPVIGENFEYQKVCRKYFSMLCTPQTCPLLEKTEVKDENRD